MSNSLRGSATANANEVRRAALAHAMRPPMSMHWVSDRTGKACTQWNIGPVLVVCSISGENVFWTASFVDRLCETDDAPLIGAAELWEDAMKHAMDLTDDV